MRESKEQTPRQALEADLRKVRSSYNLGSRLWSFCHHFTTFGAAVLAVLTTVASQQEGWGDIPKDDLIVYLGGATALLASLAAVGGFQRKWVANRLDRGRVHSLLLDVRGENPDLARIRAELKRTVERHDLEVLGIGLTSLESSQGAPRQPSLP